MAIVVALHKSGTNLVTRLFRSLDFAPVGAGVRESYDTIFRAVEEPRDGGRRPHTRRTILTDADALLDVCVRQARPGTCVFLHAAPRSLGQPDLMSTNGWPVFFNYRDPRAVLVSFVHYLTGAAKEGFTEVEGFDALAHVLKRLPSTRDRLSFVMRYVPNYLHRAFAANAWLLRQPHVLRISYEELVGARGGGSDQLQRRAVGLVMQHLGVGGDVDAVARALYSADSRTFRRGDIASWRQDFTPDLLDRFDETYGSLLTTYGYA